MKIRFCSLIVMTAAMVTLACLAATSALGQSATSRTQDVARMPNGKPDFSGVWDHPRVVDVTRDGNAWLKTDSRL